MGGTRRVSDGPIDAGAALSQAMRRVSVRPMDASAHSCSIHAHTGLCRQTESTWRTSWSQCGPDPENKAQIRNMVGFGVLGGEFRATVGAVALQLLSERI